MEALTGYKNTCAIARSFDRRFRTRSLIHGNDLQHPKQLLGASQQLLSADELRSVSRFQDGGESPLEDFDAGDDRNRDVIWIDSTELFAHPRLTGMR
jgi:hypothetical protein